MGIKYLIFDIKNLEPIKIGAKGVRNQLEKSITYLPGTSIRGGIISKIIKHFDLDTKKLVVNRGKNEIFSKKQLLDNLSFYNAYPTVNNKLYLIPPNYLRVDKHNYREARLNYYENTGEKGSNNQATNIYDQVTNLLNKDDNTTKNVNPIPLDFIRIEDVEGSVNINDKVVKNFVVEKELRLHHSEKQGEKQEKKDNLFRYEAIKKNHTFKGIIKGEESLLTKIKEAIEEDNKIYLGGSKGSGYGLCQMDSPAILDDYTKVKKKLSIGYETSKNSKELIITCLSDCIFRDENGNPTNHILPSYINEVLDKEGVVGKLNKVIADSGYSQGYNTTWRARYPKETTVKAGSVMKYFYSEDITNKEKEAIEQTIEKNLFGMRTNEGYGWVCVNLDMPNKIDLANKRLQREEKKTTELVKSVSNDPTFELITKSLNNAKKRWLQSFILKEMDSGKNDKIIVFKNVNSNKENIMKEIVEKSYKNKEGLDKNRDYFLDNEIFSIKGVNLAKLCSYFGKDENSKNEAEEINKYLTNKLSTKKGQLFYAYSENDKEELLRDIIITAIEIGGADNE